MGSISFRGGGGGRLEDGTGALGQLLHLAGLAPLKPPRLPPASLRTPALLSWALHKPGLSPGGPAGSPVLIRVPPSPLFLMGHLQIAVTTPEKCAQ